MLRILAVIGLDRRFRHQRHFVDSPVSEIDHFFGMSKRPTCFHRGPGVTRIGAGHRITLRHTRSQLLVSNLSGESSVATALQFPVPPAVFRITGGHPHFDLDRGICARRRFRY